MINAEEARKICLKTRNEEIKAVETYLKNYVFNIIDDSEEPDASSSLK